MLLPCMTSALHAKFNYEDRERFIFITAGDPRFWEARVVVSLLALAGEISYARL